MEAAATLTAARGRQTGHELLSRCPWRRPSALQQLALAAVAVAARLPRAAAEDPTWNLWRNEIARPSPRTVASTTLAPTTQPVWTTAAQAAPPPVANPGLPPVLPTKPPSTGPGSPAVPPTRPPGTQPEGGGFLGSVPTTQPTASPTPPALPAPVAPGTPSAGATSPGAGTAGGAGRGGPASGVPFEDGIPDFEIPDLVHSHRARREERRSSGGSPGLPFVDPLKIVSELFIFIIAIVVLAILWNQRKRVLVLLTGEDRIHVTPLDCVWWTCFRCCGTCHHEWTRWLTCCSCCPNRVRGRNLVKLAGSMVGAATHSVELSNIVVGDLPFRGRGSFYLSCECAQNPPMRTSTADWKLPKLVHFPEVFTLRLRFSPLEPMVKITVYELNIIGSEELCSVYLNAENIILWSMESEHRTKRFAMKPRSEDMQVETPPWIVLEFDHPRNDVRDLDALAGSLSTVRTATWTATNPQTGTAGVYTDMAMKPFKHKYKLLDNYGNHVMEPCEDDLWQIEAYRDCCLGTYAFGSLGLMTLVCGYLCFRFYTWSCWRKYRQLTMALQLRPNVTKAFTPAMLIHIADSCADFAAGNDLEEGKHPCRPSNKHIEAVCHRLPDHQHKPTAFTGFIQRYWGTDIEGAPCLSGICEWHSVLATWDILLLVLCVLVVIWVFCLFKPCVRGLVEKKKRRIMAKRTKAHAATLRGTTLGEHA